MPEKIINLVCHGMKPQSKNWKVLFGIFMVLIYLGMGVMVAVFNAFGIDKVLSIIIGALFFLYGVFRGYRMCCPRG